MPLQQRLWTKKVKNVEYCSEAEDSSIPTVKIDAPNTEKGKTCSERSPNQLQSGGTLLSFESILFVLSVHN